MKKRLFIFFAFAVVFGGSFAGYQYWRGSVGVTEVLDQKTTQPSADQFIVAGSISGRGVVEDKGNRRPIAVVMDNAPEARPQTGLFNSEVVYETLAEGGITRLLALFQSRDTSMGPVRSARDYFARIASDWQALFAHVGGSPTALANIANGTYPGLIDINEFYRANYFERFKNRPAPHNVYTDTGKLYNFLGVQAVASSQRRTLFTFKKDQPVVKGSGNNIVVVPAYAVTIDFSFPRFKVDFTYNPKTNLYARQIGGKADIDAGNGQPIEAKTIIAQYVDIAPVPKDKDARVDIRLIGEGKAQVFMDGIVQDAFWRKAKNGRTMFLNSEGKELEINKGLVWVAIVPNNKNKVVTYDGAVVNPDGSVEIQEAN